jgi:hypothetical protein
VGLALSDRNVEVKVEGREQDLKPAVDLKFQLVNGNLIGDEPGRP